nr:hypothetical protein [uncultured Prevotella sp.]
MATSDGSSIQWHHGSKLKSRTKAKAREEQMLDFQEEEAPF